MSRDTRGYVNLDYVVQSVMVSLKQSSFHNYQRLLHFTAEGFTELNMFTMNNIKVAYLPVNSNLTVDLPEDFISYVKIGIEIGGRVWTLGLDSNIALPRKVDKCGNTLAQVISCSNDSDISSVSPLGGFLFAAHYRNGNYVGELYGMGGGFNVAYYTLDMERRQIVLTSDVPQSEIILEYRSSGVMADGSSVVPRQAVKALKAYVLWQLIENDPRVPMNLKQRNEQQYYIAYDKLKFFEDHFTMEEYLDHTYSESKSSPRR